MNKKVEEYVKKYNRIIKTLITLAIAIFLLGVLISIVQYLINKSQSNEEPQNIANGDGIYTTDIKENSIFYTDSFDMNLKINDFDTTSNYNILININNENIINENIVNSENKFNITLKEEGKKELNIILTKNEKEMANDKFYIYYIKPYSEQYLDELTNKGTQVHYRSSGKWEKYDISLRSLKNLGVQYIRADLYYSSVVRNDGTYNFYYYDEWIKMATDNDIKILLEFNGFPSKITTDDMTEKFTTFVNETISRYPQIKNYEVLNEPNFSYKTEEELKYYSNIVGICDRLSKENQNNPYIVAGALAAIGDTNSNAVSTVEFFDKLTRNSGYKAANAYSYHPYDGSDGKEQNPNLNKMLSRYKELLNQYGGFLRNYATEYGISVYSRITEEMQAYKLIQQTVLMDKYGVDFSSIYNFWNTGTDENDKENNYGLVNNDYTPKPSYYSMKNYYQNTNGSEYIGTLDIEDGLEAHVYDKDGKPLIIAWSDNTDNTYDFTLGEMTAKDIYGKDITPDESGNIQITTSPVYLYNVGNHYFYQAISNTVTQKYDEFTSNFSGEIAKVSGLQASIDNLKQKIQDISSNSTLDETTAINLMEQHYNLGNAIIQAYKSGNLQVEYVKLSSMLDMLDDIGDSFEDLVTLSAKTRNVDLTDTLNSITNAGNLINDSDIEMVYPTKILEFSQDFYDKANYINGLEEENDIKTGLIVSKNLHSKLLANWATEFANLYVDEYIANNPVEIEYSTIDYTNQDVTATLKTNANITVTNNSNSKTYTFNQNGSFTFEYTIKGRAFTKTATVSNIDKAAPTVTGVENDKLYLDSITPQIQDENLQEVKLYKDNNEVQNYQTNTTISEDGNYKIVAIDKASNQTETTFYISRNPATISYSATDLTNQDVIATINSNFDVEVLNNSNQNTYTFNQNGEFTFEIKIKGTSLNLTATVNNIDKTPPVITGVEENKQYIDKAIPMVTDENLNEVKLYLNSYLEEGYVPGTELTEEGFYKLVVNDKAGNEVTVEFRIMEDISEEYIRKGSYIINIKNNTTLSEFDQKIDMGLDYEIVRNGNPLAENDIIATGDILRTSAGEELTLIVNGDINKDGDVNIKDIVKLRKYLLLRNNLDELELIAADCNIDGRSISIKDLIRMRLIVLERGVT